MLGVTDPDDVVRVVAALAPSFGGINLEDISAPRCFEIERRLRVTEQVIKFITVRTDEEEKRVAKIKAHRAAHVKRSALPQENTAETADISAAAAQQQVAAVPAQAEAGEPVPAAQG